MPPFGGKEAELKNNYQVLDLDSLCANGRLQLRDLLILLNVIGGRGRLQRRQLGRDGVVGFDVLGEGGLQVAQLGVLVVGPRLPVGNGLLVSENLKCFIKN